ncbi:hypothetical protein MIR68_002369 [Amoeboaphelidium protococcarum]|nr:hypothetical protein MIR68_002369 [Amoeboaphelidium protococcarum]
MSASFESVDLLNVLSSPPSSLLLDSGEERHLTVLRRPELEAVRDEVQRIVEIPAHLQRYSKRVIVGPAGVGKSLLLYLCARDCIVKGSWFVLYIASTTRFDEQEDTRVSVEILNMILEMNAPLLDNHQSNDSLKTIRESALNGVRNSGQATHELMNILGFMSRCKVPVFVGIDQWNCLQEAGGIKQPLLKNLFGHFSKFNGSWGFTLLAVSSSFDLSNSGMFSDYDAVLAPKKISLYRKEEWQAMVTHYRNRRLLPPITQLSDEDLLKLTGTVPRLLMAVKQEYMSMHGDPTWSSINAVNVRNANLKYFTERVKRVIQRHSDKDSLLFATCVVTNQYQKQLSASNPWIDSGLFYFEEGVLVPIASDVLTAMNDVLS